MVLQLCNNHGVQILLDIRAKCSNIHCLLQVGAICLQYSHDDVIGISQIFIVLWNLSYNIHVSTVAYIQFCALRAGQKFILVSLDK